MIKHENQFSMEFNFKKGQKIIKETRNTHNKKLGWTIEKDCKVTC